MEVHKRAQVEGNARELPAWNNSCDWECNSISNRLTRASRTFLSQRGFTDVLSDSVAPKALAVANRMPLPVPRRINMDLELRDKLGANEITFQFAAFRVLEGTNSPRPKSVYFTYQFFNSLPTRTERMRLSGGRMINTPGSRGRRDKTSFDPLSNGASSYGADRDSFLRRRPAGSLSEPYVLVRENIAGGGRRTRSLRCQAGNQAYRGQQSHWEVRL